MSWSSGLVGGAVVAANALLGWLLDARLVAPAVAVTLVAAAVHQTMWPRWRWRMPTASVSAWPLCFFWVFVVALRAPLLALLLVAPVAVLLVGWSLGGRRVRRAVRRAPLRVVLLHAGAVVGLGVLASGRLVPRLDDGALQALYATAPARGWSQDDMNGAVARVLAVLAAGAGGEQAASAAPKSPMRRAPGRLGEADRGGVHVALWRDGEAPLEGSAHGGTIGEALDRATAAALGQAAHPARWRSSAARVRLMIDVAGPAVRIRRRWLHRPLLALMSLLSPVGSDRWAADGWLSQLSYRIEPGIDGLLLRVAGRAGGMLPAEPVLRGWLTPRVRGRAVKVRALLERLSERTGLPPGGWRRADAELYSYRSFSFGRLGGPGRGAVRLVRGNVLVERLDRAALVGAFGAAAGWLARAVRSDGRFDYDYLPTRDRPSGEYNLVRHAGAIYGLLYAHRVAATLPALAGDAAGYLEAARRALDWLRPRLGRPEGGEPGMLALIDEQAGASSGAAALTLMALVEPATGPHPVGGPDPHLAAALDEPGLRAGLARTLEAMIDARGRVFGTWVERRRGGEVEQEPLYYPGEVMLALVRLYRLGAERRWLDAARRIADWQLERYRRQRPSPDHWVIQGLAELHGATGEVRYAQACLRMADRYAAEIYAAADAPFPDYRGAYRRADDLPRTTRACARSEAMGAAFELARALGREVARYRGALLAAARHILEQQFRRGNSFYLPNAARARGAIRMGLVDQQCRIDNNQHGLVAFGHALRALRP